MYIHGGDIYRNRADLDFSININPLGAPDLVDLAMQKAVSLCGRYPDPEAGELKKSVSQMLGAPKEYLLFGNGASELLMAVVHAIKPRKTVIPVPSFYGYEHVAKAAESEIIFYEMKQEHNFCLTEDFDAVLPEGADLLFLANPGNPSGGLLQKDRLARLLRRCLGKGIFVVLDECFIEFCGGRHSMISEIEEWENLILVRAFTKIFAIPGARLGYLACKNRELLKKIERQLPEWNLSCFAQEAGRACAGQAEFLLETEHYVKKERRFLEEGLKKNGFLVFESMANFLLVYSEEPVYERLLKQGILIRDCGNFRGLRKGFYRIAVKGRKENEILLNCLGGGEWNIST